MGYFSNGSEGMDYEERYCSRCVHGAEAVERRGGDNHCAVWLAHLIKGYEECNHKDSILHMLIPRKSPFGNQQCKMFLTRDMAIHDPDQGELFVA